MEEIKKFHPQEISEDLPYTHPHVLRKQNEDKKQKQKPNFHVVNVVQNGQKQYSVRMLGILHRKHLRNAAEKTVLDI